MEDIIIFEDNEIDEIYELVNEAELFFHPIYAIDGKINYTELLRLNNKNKFVIFDRNIVSYLIEYTTNGILRDDYSMIIIALIMLYCNANQFQISVGFALQEYFSTKKDNKIIEQELNRFLTITEYYPSMIWKNVLYSRNKEIPKITKIKNYNRDADFSYKGGHQLMHECEMIALARIYKSDKTNKDKLIEFIEWNYENTLICQYTIAYAILLFGGQEGVRAPKNINSKNINIIIDGCINQAWDLTYLSTWSTLYWNEEESDNIHFFVTNDKLLKLIFNFTHSGINIVDEMFNKRESKEINSRMLELRDNRIKPNVEMSILEKLKEDEIRKLESSIQNR